LSGLVSGLQISSTAFIDRGQNREHHDCGRR
jgi:hypothetical protein